MRKTYALAMVCTNLLTFSSLGRAEEAKPGIVEALNAACAKVTAYAAVQEFREELAQICVGGAATPKALAMVKTAYRGIGEASAYAPYKIHSEDGESEMWIAGAQIFPRRLADVVAATDKAILTSLDDGDVISHMELLKTLPKPNADYRSCMQLRQTLTTEIALMSFDSKIIRKDCVFTPSGEPGLALILATLDPTANNPDNRVMKQFNLMVEAQGSTYLFNAAHMATVNYHFPSIVESRMRATVPVLVQAFYAAIMKAPVRTAQSH